MIPLHSKTTLVRLLLEPASPGASLGKEAASARHAASATGSVRDAMRYREVATALLGSGHRTAGGSLAVRTSAEHHRQSINVRRICQQIKSLSVAGQQENPSASTSELFGAMRVPQRGPSHLGRWPFGQFSEARGLRHRSGQRQLLARLATGLGDRSLARAEHRRQPSALFFLLQFAYLICQDRPPI